MVVLSKDSGMSKWVNEEGPFGLRRWRVLVKRVSFGASYLELNQLCDHLSVPLWYWSHLFSGGSVAQVNCQPRVTTSSKTALIVNPQPLLAMILTAVFYSFGQYKLCWNEHSFFFFFFFFFLQYVGIPGPGIEPTPHSSNQSHSGENAGASTR